METTCFDPSKLSFHNIDDNKIQKTSERSYTIALGTGGISYGQVKYNGSSEGLSLSLVDDGGVPSALEVPYSRFLNTFHVFENTSHDNRIYKIKLTKQGCGEEIMLEVHQNGKPDLCPLSIGTRELGLDEYDYRVRKFFGDEIMPIVMKRDPVSHEWRNVAKIDLSVSQVGLPNHSEKKVSQTSLINGEMGNCNIPNLVKKIGYRAHDGWRNEVAEEGTVTITIKQDGGIYAKKDISFSSDSVPRTDLSYRYNDL